MSVSTNPTPLMKRRILVADDEFMIASDVEFILSNAGADVRVVGTAEEALQSATDDDLDGALLDMRLGSDSSLRVADKLTERKIPFLFFSGQILPPEVTSRYPHVRALVKPVDYGKLLDATAQMLQAH